MFKAWLNMWRNTFNYTGTATQKEYWLACILNVPIMYVLVIPFALIVKSFSISPEVASAIFLIAFHFPTLSLYFRRANDANWKTFTTLLLIIVTPIISGFIVGAFPSVPKGQRWPRFYSLIGKLFALSCGLFLYGGFLGIILHGDPIAFPGLSYAGLVLGTVTLFFAGTKVLLGK